MGTKNLKLKLSAAALKIFNEFMNDRKDFDLRKFIEWSKVKSKSIEAVGEITCKFLDATIVSDADIIKNSNDNIRGIIAELKSLLTLDNITDEDKKQIYRMIDRCIDIIDESQKRANLRKDILVYSAAAIVVTAVVAGGMVKLNAIKSNAMTFSFKAGRAIKNVLNGFK